MEDKKKDIYAPCRCIERPCPDLTIDQELLKEIATDFRTLPSFENTTYRHIHRKHNSLQTNEFLKCRWKEYKAHIEDKVFSPFVFPDVRDLHFYQGYIQFNPSLSIHRYPHHKFHLKPGPGVDNYGQMPIPNELFMVRGIVEKKAGNQKNFLKKGSRCKGKD